MLEEFETTIIKLSKSYNIPPLTWEDITQELRIHLWKNRGKYNKKKSSYRTWAFIVCRNKLKDLHRYYTQQKRDERKKISLEELPYKDEIEG